MVVKIETRSPGRQPGVNIRDAVTAICGAARSAKLICGKIRPILSKKSALIRLPRRSF